MSEVKNTIVRGSQNSIDNFPVTNGKIIFSTDTGRLFMDIKNERIEYTDFIKGLKYSEVISLTHPLQKIYLTTDTKQLLAYDFANKKWISYSGGEIDPSTYVSNLRIDENNNIIIIFGDGSEQILENNPIAQKLEEIDTTLERYERVIEIVEREYNLNDNSEVDNSEEGV